MYPKLGLFIIAIILPLFGCNSQTVHTGTAPITRNLELEAFKEVVSWPNSTLQAKALLVEQFLASRRYEEAYMYYQERAKQQPNVPLFLALEGLFQAKMAPDVIFYKRIGWVKEANAKLDLAVSREPGLSRYFRGLVLAELPSFPFGKTNDALADLDWFFQNEEKFPFGLRRNAYLALAKAYTTRGEEEKAKAALEKSGYSSMDSESARFNTDAWITAKGGYRFSAPELINAEAKVYVVRGDDFADFAFVETADSVVAIDAGATNERAGDALNALRRITTKPLSHLILTHAHWDHVGGVDAYLKANPRLEIIAQEHFAEELELVNTTGVRFQYFFGTDQRHSYEAKPNRLISKRESLIIGGTEFVFYPVRGGETHDALLIHLPASGIVFMGDTMMPYIGAPFINEGSAEGLQETMTLVRSLKPKLLIHGHTPLTINWPIESFAGLEPALDELHQRTLGAIHNGKTLIEVLHQNIIPSVLRTEPSAVVPYLVMRDNYIKRLYEQNTGYWKFDGEGIERFSPSEIASALDLLGGGREQAFINSAKSLYAGSDYALALRMENYGLLKYPKNTELSRLRLQTLGRLQEKNQQINPFKFIIYSEQAGSELPLIPQ